MREPACMAHELDQLLKDVAFTRLLGLRLKDMSAGRCTLEVPFQETFERPGAVRPRSSSLELTSPRSDLTSQGRRKSTRIQLGSVGGADLRSDVVDAELGDYGGVGLAFQDVVAAWLATTSGCVRNRHFARLR